jgi:hypothetical protein
MSVGVMKDYKLRDLHASFYLDLALSFHNKQQGVMELTDRPALSRTRVVDVLNDFKEN